MYQEINFYIFCDAFHHMDRKEHFTYKGKRALFDYIESIEEDTGEEIELDVIAICCDFSEMTLGEINQDYQREYESLDEACESLSEETIVIPVNDETLIIQSF